MTFTPLGAAKNGGKELVKAAAKEGAEFVSENVAKTAAKTTAKEGAKTAGETLTETIAKTATKETTEALGEKVAKESAKDGTESVVKTAEKKAVEDSTKTAAKKSADDVGESTAKTAVKTADGASETSTKDKILSNIAESKNARESSNVKEYVAKEKQTLGEVAKNADELSVRTSSTSSTSLVVLEKETFVENSLISIDRQRHILYGDVNGGGHKFTTDTLLNGKSKFPLSWSSEKIIYNVEDIATDPTLVYIQQTGRVGQSFTRSGDPVKFKVEGVRDGQNIRVIVEPSGRGVVTAFPID